MQSPSHNPVSHATTKHMELEIFFLRENRNKSIIIQHIPVTDQTVDVLTNPLSPPRFLTLAGKLKVVDRSSLNQPPYVCRGNNTIIEIAIFSIENK